MEAYLKHAAVWIDHHEARVFHVDPTNSDESTIAAPGAHVHRRSKDQELRVRNHPDDEHKFFHAVARALEGQDEILILGPSKTKLHFFRYLHEHEPALEPRVVGVESADHPTDAQLVAHIRHYFHESLPRRGAER
jgi:stalled ribosome rescue protein Dom34